jgi:hypothetical protein
MKAQSSKFKAQEKFKTRTPGRARRSSGFAVLRFDLPLSFDSLSFELCNNRFERNGRS